MNILKKITLLQIIIFFGLATVNGQTTVLEDINIQDAIEDQYRFDHAVDANKIDIEVDEGIVMLTGTVSNLMAKERATKIARLVKGVRSVSNNIEVDPPSSLSDEEIEDRVEQALLTDPATDLYELDVLVTANTVTLTGTVESFQEKKLCANVAKSIRGVVDLINNIDVSFDQERSDTEIRSEIKKALQWKANIDDGLINVEVDNGRVRLSGVVGSAAEKSSAFYTAWVTGVSFVDDSELKVEWWAKDEDLRQYKNLPRTDDEIKQAIIDAAAYDPRVSTFDIIPEVDDGHVTLRGVVDNLRAKNAATRLAKNTTGVTDVTNRIKVRWTDIIPEDEEIENDITEALEDNAITHAWKIDVGVVNGIATLSGVVDSYLEKQEAEWVASGVPGVIEVNNVITVNFPYSYYWWDHYPYYEAFIGPPVKTDPTPDYPTDLQLIEKIEKELFWSPYVDLDQVEVTVENGHATLEGTVDSMREYLEASRNALEGGAISVTNNLDIKE